jgi:N-acetylmuramoyl-L-alanine amidase
MRPGPAGVFIAALFAITVHGFGAREKPPSEFPVALCRDGQTHWIRQSIPDPVTQASLTPGDRIRALFAATLQPPSEETIPRGFAPLFPADTTLDAIVPIQEGFEIRMTLPVSFLTVELDGFLHDEMLRQVMRWHDAMPELGQLELKVRCREGEPYADPHTFLRIAPPPSKLDESAAVSDRAPKALEYPTQGQGQPQGALTGASIFLAPGHGWWFGSSWATQRSATYEIIEDHLNAEIVLQYLARYLWNAGARVYTCRERDINPNMVIVDNGAAGYSETGNWQSESATGAYKSNFRKAETTTGAPTATAVFTPNVPEEGMYAVYVWYRAAASATTTDARFLIQHTGGTTTWIQDQNRDGQTWKYVGTYHFDKGSNPATGSVVITNQSAAAGNFVVADAVRLGGGMGEYTPPGAPGTSGRPRFEEAGTYHAGFMGYSYTLDRVAGMPNYAAWEHETWESGTSVYLSLHNNAAGGTGTETFYSATSGVAGSKELAEAVQAEIIRDVRAGWYASWANRGVKTSNLTEIVSSSNSEMPAALTEIGFFDRPDRDVFYLKEAEFSNICARAIYQGMVGFYTSYYSSKFTNTTLLPEPPINPSVRNDSTGGVRISWDSPPFNTGNNYLGSAATRYKVYRSRNGKGFDNGIETTQTSLVLTEGLQPGEVWYFRVTALNAGGESFPTEVLPVRIRQTSPLVLLVNGFDRLDRGQNVMETDRQTGRIISRQYLWKMNTRDYLISHAVAVAAAGFDFDSASHKAVAAGRVALGDYAAVLWCAGEQGGPNPIVDVTYDPVAIESACRTRLAAYLDAGGRLFLSGSEISQNLGAAGKDIAFLNQRLRASYAADSAGVYTVQGAPGSIFHGLSFSFDDGTGSSYKVESADTLSLMPGALPALTSAASTSPILLEDFDDLAEWWDPNSSGQTNADAATEGVVDTTVKFQGTASGRLRYVWGTGTHIRWYNSARPTFPASSVFSIRVYGDGSGHRMRISLRDSDNDIFASDWLTVDWTGWREVRFDVSADPKTFWYAPGDGVLTGPLVGFDSIELQKAGTVGTGDLYFDFAQAISTSSASEHILGLQYGRPGTLVFLTVPLETITDPSIRAEVIRRVLAFFFPSSQNGLVLY